ncbi:GDSL esterase/lipase At2g30220-like [Tasmannia lanceolata]|uniref:GDSL esterase/lipase At2g30220-like n=1 Tax=Tasmannia lanceolata TaxID=3420 RepID=UPI00406280AB
MATILLSILLVYLSAIISMSNAATPTKFPAILIFGDSTVDTGNNNYITTWLKANHSPYGVNFPNHLATGRFSNGKLVPDLLVSHFGIKQLIPPFLDPHLSDEDVRTGVCFASAGSGFDDLTTVSSGVIPVMKQPEMFKQYLARLKGLVGEEEASKIINGSLILIGAGTNDVSFSFYDLSTRKLQYNISGYQDFLQQKIQLLIKEIYDLGGRVIGVTGLPPIGCTPIQRTLNFKTPADKTCVDNQNMGALNYNSKLKKLLPEVQASLPGSKIFYINLYDPLMDIITHPQKYGFEQAMRGCCGTGFLELGPFCSPLSPTCPDASKFVFWDSIHPTQSTYQVLAKSIIETIHSIV